MYCLTWHSRKTSFRQLFQQQRTKGNQYLSALKVDMFKAYDKVNWEILALVLDKMGFPPLCRQWIM